jgi:hypothetical protein
MEPDEIKTFPLPLHIRNKDYQISETSVASGETVGFDIATGPDHNSNSQGQVLIPCVIVGDRGTVKSATISGRRCHLAVRVYAKNCPPKDVEFDLWVENNFLRCEPSGTFAMAELL